MDGAALHRSVCDLISIFERLSVDFRAINSSGLLLLIVTARHCTGFDCCSMRAPTDLMDLVDLVDLVGVTSS